MFVLIVGILSGCAGGGALVPARSLGRGEVALAGSAGADGADTAELRGVGVPWVGLTGRAGVGAGWEVWGAGATQPGLTWVGSGAVGVKYELPGTQALAWSLGAQASYLGGDYGGISVRGWTAEAPLRASVELGRRWGLEGRASVGAYGLESPGTSGVSGGVGHGGLGVRWRASERWGLAAEGWGRWTPVAGEGRAGTWIYGGSVGLEVVAGR